ncbi:MAG: hypothetical protein ACI865_001886 [Flavobacteriaceae bacterium]|jgi:hypothetical protein
MAKLMKISGRSLGILLEWSLMLIIAFAFAIRTSPVQTYIAQKAASYLSDELGTTVKIDKVAIIFFDELALDGFLMLDQQGDSLFAAETVFATIDAMRLSDNYFKIGKLKLDGGYGHVQKNAAGELNLKFLTEYFSSDKKKKKKKIEFAITTVELKNTHFIYDDHRKEPTTFGVDYFHIDADKINGTIDEISIKNKDITANIKNLTASEKSGLKLKNLSAEADLSGKGVYLSKLNLTTNKSRLAAPKFNLLTNYYSDFYQFIDSVSFDAKITESLVSMEDVALFGTALEGMDEMITFKTNISKKVNDLKLSELDIQIKEKTRIRGTLNLVNFKELQSATFDEQLDYAYVDIDELEKIKLPKSASSDYLSLDASVKRLSYFDAKDLTLKGTYSKFVLALAHVQTALGSAKMDRGMLFTQSKKQDSYYFSRYGSDVYDIKVEHFNLGGFLANSDLGEVDGTLLIAGQAFSPTKIMFNDIDGKFTRFDLMNYAYSNTTIDNGTFKNNIFDANISINDPNLTLEFDGSIDLNGTQNMTFDAKVSQAALDQLGFTNTQASLATTIQINLNGNNVNNYDGEIIIDSFSYIENSKEIVMPHLELAVERSEEEDKFTIHSTIAEVDIRGKLDFNHIWNHVNFQMSKILPALYTGDTDDFEQHLEDEFTFAAEVKEANELLAIFAPGLNVTNGTTLNGHYKARTADFNATVLSDLVVYQKMDFSHLRLNQRMTADSINMEYHVDQFKYNDSLSFNDLYFRTSGGQNNLSSEFTWDQETPKASSIEWATTVKSIDDFRFIIEPSYFSIKERRWEIADASNVLMRHDTIEVKRFLLKKGDQEIKLSGKISKNDDDKLKFDIKNFHLDEISEFISDSYKFTGELNSFGYIANPYTNFKHAGTAHILGFYIDQREIGDLLVNSRWDGKRKSIRLNGDLMYKGLRNFDFEGSYSVEMTEENLDFNFVFDKTDIEFTNAFLDPDVIDNVRGFLNGSVAVTGTLENPVLKGEIDIQSGGAKIELLGAEFEFTGPIDVQSDGFFLNGIPVMDEEGNAGKLIGSVYHDNFENFNFDLLFDLETDALAHDPIQPWKPVPLDRFLVMNSSYEPGDVYYGKAYVTGTANIFGQANNLDITVNMKSRRGTKINFPMFGSGEIDEEFDFIEFVDHNAPSEKDPKINFSGVHLDLSFEATKEAEMKIIFNEALGDIITATGTGTIDVVLDNQGDIKMDGTYTIVDGLYDFAMGPIKQKFYIEEGGSISWTGSPYDANLDLRTYHRVNANISELSSDKFGSSNSSEEIQCYLNLKETLLKPAIDFDIKAPNANETGKSLINRVKSDPDELNRQFFSLLLWKKFQPLSGEGGAGGSAAVDLIANQINAVLSKISSDYALNIDLDNDEFTGENTFEFGVQKGFLDDRLLVTGSFGVESQDDKHSHESGFIGDLNLEYLLNESGTFRVNIFNESNAKSVIQNNQQGHFTQGAGLHYQEDFETTEDFKAIQYFLDVFRKKENKRFPIKRKRRQVPVPPKQEGTVPETTSP